MSLISLSEHRLIQRPTGGRSYNPGRTAAWPVMGTEPSLLPTLATVFYVTSTFRTRPRQIDHYIDYFGERVIDQR